MQHIVSHTVRIDRIPQSLEPLSARNSYEIETLPFHDRVDITRCFGLTRKPKEIDPQSHVRELAARLSVAVDLIIHKWIPKIIDEFIVISYFKSQHHTWTLDLTGQDIRCLNIVQLRTRNNKIIRRDRTPTRIKLRDDWMPKIDLLGPLTIVLQPGENIGHCHLWFDGANIRASSIQIEAQMEDVTWMAHFRNFPDGNLFYRGQPVGPDPGSAYAVISSYSVEN